MTLCNIAPLEKKWMEKTNKKVVFNHLTSLINNNNPGEILKYFYK